MERGILEIDKALDDLAIDPLEVLPSLPPLPFHTTITIVCVCIYICISGEPENFDHPFQFV